MTVSWDLDRLFAPPAVYEAPGFEGDGVQPLFYEGLPYQGRATRVFAWYGVPSKDTAPGAPAPDAEGRWPAMVLVHGGGGTAFRDWVQLWNRRGYAALAMDTCGGVPLWSAEPWFRVPWPRHAYSGPQGWNEIAEVDLPIPDQWFYHAVAAITLGHSFLRTRPEVDPTRIGITGISYGGMLTCLTAGVDPRFRFAAPVYGCGYLDCRLGGLYDRGKVDADALERMLALWDARHYLPTAAMSLLWLNGTNDAAFPLDAWQPSYWAPAGPRTLCLRVRMPHAHGGAGEKPEEIRVFADSFARGGTPLATVTAQGSEGRQAWVRFRGAEIVQAELNYTRATGFWADRQWSTLPAVLDLQNGVATAQLPYGTSVYYFNLIDSRGSVVSSEHVEDIP
jgi:dienelactone hydrolase